MSRLPDERIAKRVELFRKAVAKALKRVNGVVVEQISDLEKLIKDELEKRAGFCKNVGASAELESDMFTATAVILIFCDELETEVEIPLKLVADTKHIDEKHIGVEVGDA
jgi:hypothetical protein